MITDQVAPDAFIRHAIPDAFHLFTGAEEADGDLDCVAVSEPRGCILLLVGLGKQWIMPNFGAKLFTALRVQHESELPNLKKLRRVSAYLHAFHSWMPVHGRPPVP